MRGKNIQGAEGHAAQNEPHAGYIHAMFGCINCRSELPKVGVCVDLQAVCVTTSCKNFCILPRMDGVCLFGMNKRRQFQFL
jgi:hypothetical protein